MMMMVVKMMMMVKIVMLMEKMKMMMMMMMTGKMLMMMVKMMMMMVKIIMLMEIMMIDGDDNDYTDKWFGHKDTLSNWWQIINTCRNMALMCVYIGQENFITIKPHLWFFCTCTLYAYFNEYFFFFKTTILTIHLCKTSQSKILEGLVLKFAHLT